MTLRHRLSLVVAMALSAPLLLTLYNVVHSQVALDREARAEAGEAARQVSAEFARMIESTRQLIIVMSQNRAVSDDEATCAAYLKSVISDLPLYREAAMLDTAGKHRCSTIPFSASLAMRDTIASAADSPLRQLTIGILAPRETDETFATGVDARKGI